MATSTITLYTTNLTPKRNAWVDDFDTYLSSCTQYTISNFQFIKHDLDLEIKIDFSQTYVDNPTYNYVKIVSNGVTRYYFIIDTEWKASSTVKYYLSMDTINSFQTKLATAYWSEKTNIIRQHTDRFYNDGDTDSLYRVVDRVDEGMSNLPMIRTSKNIIRDNYSTTKWYLLYCNADDEAIDCYLIPSVDKSYTLENQTTTLYASDITGNMYYYFMYFASPNSQFTFNGTTYTVSTTYSYKLQKRSDYTNFELYQIPNDGSSWTYLGADSSLVFETSTVSIQSSSLANPTDTSNWINVLRLVDSSNYVTYGTSSISVTIDSISAVDRTLSSIIKIVECPYIPVDHDANNIPEGFQYYEAAIGQAGSNIRTFRLKDLTQELTHTIDNSQSLGMLVSMPQTALRYGMAHSMVYESKLYNSSFYNDKYVYDSFAYTFQPENLISHTSNTMAIEFVKSGNLNSLQLFNFNCGDSKYDTEDFENILICQRNNEYPIFNSGYLDYIRNGYNYDVKARNQQLWTNIANTGISVAGSIIGFKFGNKTQNVSSAAGISMATSAVNSAVGIISNYIAADRAIAQKKAELRAQANSIEAADDLDLFNNYSGNALWHITYQLTDNSKNAIYNLFRLTGYAVNSNGVPDFDSRRAYNFVQCEPVLTNEADPEFKDYLDDIKARYQAGVTYYHPFKVYSSGESVYYDWNQSYENWETWICER